MIRIQMGDTTLSDEEAGKWMADIKDIYPNINIVFSANPSQIEEFKAILEERAAISIAMVELVTIIDLLKRKLDKASDNQLDELEDIEKSIKELYAGIQIVKFNRTVNK